MTKSDILPRLERFSNVVIKYCRSIKIDVVNRPLVNQIVKSSTSVGANYSESQNSTSKRDFRNKIYICKKEINETRYWLKLLLVDARGDIKILNALLKECNELVKIFQSIANKLES